MRRASRPQRALRTAEVDQEGHALQDLRTTTVVPELVWIYSSSRLFSMSPSPPSWRQPQPDPQNDRGVCVQFVEFANLQIGKFFLIVNVIRVCPDPQSFDPRCLEVEIETPRGVSDTFSPLKSEFAFDKLVF